MPSSATEAMTAVSRRGPAHADPFLLTVLAPTVSRGGARPPATPASAEPEDGRAREQLVGLDDDAVALAVLLLAEDAARSDDGR